MSKDSTTDERPEWFREPGWSLELALLHWKLGCKANQELQTMQSKKMQTAERR
ncbi:MAG: hypothetical protein PHY82_11810 [Lentisphaeria bacterium]|nr:hypothetical protein [Lentisphaeria bacterium]